MDSPLPAEPSLAPLPAACLDIPFIFERIRGCVNVVEDIFFAEDCPYSITYSGQYCQDEEATLEEVLAEYDDDDVDGYARPPGIDPGAATPAEGSPAVTPEATPAQVKSDAASALPPAGPAPAPQPDRSQGAPGTPPSLGRLSFSVGFPVKGPEHAPLPAPDVDALGSPPATLRTPEAPAPPEPTGYGGPYRGRSTLSIRQDTSGTAPPTITTTGEPSSEVTSDTVVVCTPGMRAACRGRHGGAHSCRGCLH